MILPKGQTVNAKRYIEILKENLGPSLKKMGAQVLQQDGAPYHTAKAVKDWFSEQEIYVIPDCPGQSLDLNPIENIWAIIKAQIRDKDTSSLPKLEAAVKQYWEELQKCKINSVFEIR